MKSCQFLEHFNSFPNVIQYFDGVFAADTIPKKLANGHFLICNSDISSNPGTHWYCFVRNHECIECFDSLGIDKAKKSFLLSLPLIKKNSELEFNISQVQNSDSKSCGEFVIYFLINRLHNKDIELEDLLNYIFETSTEKNENIVDQFLLEHFK